MIVTPDDGAMSKAARTTVMRVGITRGFETPGGNG